MPAVIYIAQSDLYWIIDPLGEYEDVAPEDLIEACGFIPYFLQQNDERDARTQMVDRYGFGDFPTTGAAVDARGVYSYPEDPDMFPYMETSLRGETIRIYPYAFVAITNDQGTYTTRMD